MTTSRVLGNLARGSGFSTAESSTGKALGEGGVGRLVSTRGGEPSRRAGTALRTADAAAGERGARTRAPGSVSTRSSREGNAGCLVRPS